MPTRHLIGLILLAAMIFPALAENSTPAPSVDDPTRQTAVSAVTQEGRDQPKYPVSLFYSSGDAIVEYHWMPMDSEATCKAAMKILKQRYNCDRLLWREADNDWVKKWNRIRPDAPWLGDLLTDALRINRQFHNTRHTQAAAQEQGIHFWGIMALYDYGGKAECGSGGLSGMGAHWGFDPWLEAHPEYCLWDRPRITYMSGIIEYGQPEVRQEYCRQIEEMFRTDWAGYEGMFLYSFIENTEAHYTDEYIYSDFAVRDFQRRYGVDVRTQPFDLAQYYEMRGEYISQYLRDLRPLFHKY